MSSSSELSDMSKEELVRQLTASRAAAVGLQNQTVNTRAQAPIPLPSPFTADELLRLKSLLGDPAPVRQPPPGHIPNVNESSHWPDTNWPQAPDAMPSGQAQELGSDGCYYST